MFWCKQTNDEDLLEKFLVQLQDLEGDIHIPRFTLERGFDLTKELPKIGIKDVFMEGIADLSPINGYKNLYVSAAIHKAFIEVNEEGTEAAAATGFGVTAYSMSPQVWMNRPFLFYILHKPENSIVFAGRVVDPTA